MRPDILQLPQLWIESTLGEQLVRSKERLDPAAHAGEEFFYVGLEQIEGDTGRLVNVSPTFGEDLKSMKNVFNAGDILYGRLRPYLNKVHLAGMAGVCSTEIWALRPASTIDGQYATYYLRSEMVLRQTSQLAIGANLPRIDTAAFDAISIPVPPLPEQRHIVALLQRAEALRQLRRASEEKAALLLSALFLEMFGDPATNPKNWEIFSVMDLLASDRSGIRTGPFGSALKRDEYVEEGVPVWGINNLQQDGFTEEGCLYITPDKYQKLTNYTVEQGDILISRAGTVGKVGVARPSRSPSIIGTNLVRVAVDESRLIPDYLAALLSLFSSRVGQLRASGDDTSYSFLNPKVLRTLRIPVPPRPLQLAFERKLRKLQQVREPWKQSHDHLNDLFQSLLSKAFNGELTAAWREQHGNELAIAAAERDRLLEANRRGLGARWSEEDTLQPRLDEGTITNNRAVPAYRKDFTSELSPEQQELLNIATKYKDYFTPEQIYQEVGSPLSSVRRNLSLLAATGLVLAVSVPLPADRNVAYIPAYRAVRAEDRNRNHSAGDTEAIASEETVP